MLFRSKACSLIKDGDTIFIGPGTTLEQLALELKGRKGYKIRVKIGRASCRERV